MLQKTIICKLDIRFTLFSLLDEIQKKYISFIKKLMHVYGFRDFILFVRLSENDFSMIDSIDKTQKIRTNHRL